ncbi:MAG TPA: HupE/UreJ family protein, partial [Desulfosarcina sp.]|nr:HupE/UreJ family protein [Desulfosarcina sp.]
MKGNWRGGRKGAFVLVLAGLMVEASPVWAHVEIGQAAGFFTGLQHPWSGLDHVLAMIAVGLWGAQLGNPALWVLPVVFPMVMAIGAMMGLV